MSSIYNYETIEKGGCYEFGVTPKLGMGIIIHTTDGDVNLEYIKSKIRFYLDQECCAITDLETATALMVMIKNWHKQWLSTDLPTKYEVMYNIGLVLGSGCKPHTVEIKGNDGFNDGRNLTNNINTILI